VSTKTGEHPSTLVSALYCAFHEIEGDDGEIFIDRRPGNTGSWGTDQSIDDDARSPGIDVHRHGSVGPTEHIFVSYSCESAGSEAIHAACYRYRDWLGRPRALRPRSH